MVDASTRIVPGSGPVRTKQDLQAQHDMVATVKDRVILMVRQGKGTRKSWPPRRRKNSTRNGETPISFDDDLQRDHPQPSRNRRDYLNDRLKAWLRAESRFVILSRSLG